MAETIYTHNEKIPDRCCTCFLVDEVISAGTTHSEYTNESSVVHLIFRNGADVKINMNSEDRAQQMIEGIKNYMLNK